MDDHNVSEAVNGEQKQFETRRLGRTGQRSQLKERIVQLHEEAAGYESQISSKVKQVEWITKELEGVNKLWRQNLIPYARVTSLEREKERLEGDRGQLLASIAQSKGKIAEINPDLTDRPKGCAPKSGNVADIRGKIAESVEKEVAAEDQLKRVDIRAPQSGYVHQLSVHTVGGVVAPGEQMMLIVPSVDLLNVETKVPSQDVDQSISGRKQFCGSHLSANAQHLN